MKGGSGHGLLLATIAVSMFLDGLDGTIVNIALPEIADSFGIGTGDVSWVTTVYFLVMAGLILVFGRICDKGAIKKVLICGTAVFTMGSFCCGISPSFPLLLLSRAVQGVGAAMLASSAVMLGVKFLPRGKVGLSMTLVVLGSSIGIALGPTVGALITELFSWHWIFFINVPIGLLAILMAHRAVPRDGGFEEGGLDVVGSALLFAAIVCGLFVVERAPSGGFTPVCATALVLCVLLFAAFYLYDRGRESPALDLGLFQNRDFDEVTLAYVFVNVAIMGVVYLLPFLLKVVFGMDTLESGLILSLQAVPMILCCLFVNRLAARHGNTLLAVLSCLMLLAFVPIGLCFDADSPLWLLVAGILVAGSVWGLGGGPMSTRMVDSLEDRDKGSGSSMVTFVMYFGSALGTALAAGLFGLGSGEGSGSISDVSPEAFMDGFACCLAMVAVLAVAAVALSLSAKADRRDGA